MQLVDAMQAVGAGMALLIVRTGNKSLDQGGADLARVLEAGLLREAGPAPLDRPVTEPVIRDALASDHVQHGLLAFVTQALDELLVCLGGIRVVVATQTPSARD